MASGIPTTPLRNPRKWRFTWEALANIPTLRLFLFNPDVDPSIRCKNLRALLCLQESRLHVSWTQEEEEGDGSFTLWVPVPMVLIDPGPLADPIAKEDHIEIKLLLIVPVDNPIVADYRAALDLGRGGVSKGGEILYSYLPRSLDSDLKSLSAGGVHFYCKTCSTQLTRRHLRNFVEMPSVNWREAADNWFGTCCCSFGGVSEKLASDYVNTYTCAEGTCLLDSHSVIVCKDDLEGCVLQNYSDEHSEDDDRYDLLADGVLTAKDCGDPQRMSLSYGKVTEGIPDGCESPKYFLQEEERLITDLGKITLVHQDDDSSFSCTSSLVEDYCGNVLQGKDSNIMENDDVHHLILDGTQGAISEDLDLKTTLFSENNGNLFAGSSAHGFSSKKWDYCCGDKTENLSNHSCGGLKLDSSVTSSTTRQTPKIPVPERSQKLPHNGSLGGGFVSRTSNLSSDVRWVEFFCRQCSSILGSYPSANDANSPVDGGIRLFKCYISTSPPVDGPEDKFRKYTLQKVFVNLLLEVADDELSFRTIVRDLKMKSPVLQVVLLNSKAWCYSGYCSEDESPGTFSEIDLKPVVKVLFSECSTATDANSRSIEEWSTKTHVDEVYMLRYLIQELTESLRSACDRLPFSCSSLQGMSLSYLER